MSGTIVPKHAWKGLLDWELHAMYNGDTYIPFARHVRRESVAGVSFNFLFFPRLPLELQFHVLGFCDTTTLFWLMQVSKTIRKEAQKLFWSSTSVWYTVDAAWLLAGGWAGHTHNDLDSLGYMKQIVVDLADLQPLHNMSWADGVAIGAMEPITEEDKISRILGFWQVLQCRFPSATHVVLSETIAWKPGASDPADQKRIAEAAPQSLTVHIAFLEQEEGAEQCLRRHLWQLVRDSHSHTTAVWELLTQSWTPICVFPPPKRFHGPAGRYSLYVYKQWCNWNRQRARHLLALQAIEAHYLQHKGLPLVCPAMGCHELFSDASQWTVHAIQAKHNLEHAMPTEELEALFVQHEERLEELEEQCANLLTALRTTWGQAGSQQRQRAKQAFLQQVRNDPLYTHEQPAARSTIWQQYEQDMNGEVRLE